MGRRNLLDDIVHPLLGREWTFDGDQLTIDAEDDRRADLQVNVRSPALDGGLQDSVEHFHRSRLTDWIMHPKTKNQDESRPQTGNGLIIPDEGG